LVDNWLVVFIIDDLKTIPASFSVVDVTFYTFDKSRCSNWKLLQSPRYQKTVVPKFLDKNCACTQVEADTKDEAFEKGEQKIEAALNILRAFKSGFELRRPLNGLVRNETTGEEGLTLQAEWYRDRCAAWNYELSPDELKKLSKVTPALDRVLAGSAGSVMRKRVFRALRWAAMATQETEKADKILKYTTAIECLFINEKVGKAKLAGERVATFWVDDDAKRDAIFRSINRLYKLRNNIVHGEDFLVTNTDESAMDFVVRELVFAVAEEVSTNNLWSFDDFLSRLNTLKKTWKPPKA